MHEGKPMKTLFNIFWVILVGLEAAIINALTGAALCCTIIGIPFGLQYFKFIPLAFAPAGRVVVTKFSKHPVMNTLWLICGGLVVGVVYFLMGILFSITIIGIPIGAQLFKIASFNFAPFGAEVLREGEYSSYGDTQYDFNLLFGRIHANPDQVVGQNGDGSPMTARTYFGTVINEYQAYDKKISIYNALGWIIPFPSLFVLGLIFSALDHFINLDALGLPAAVIIIMVFIVAAIAIETNIVRAWERKKLSKMFKHLEPYYPNGSPQTKSKWKLITVKECYRVMGYYNTPQKIK